VRPSLLFLGVAVLSSVAMAQGGFEDRYREAIATKEPAARREAFDRALSVFLKLPTSNAGYRRWVGMAAYCAGQAGKPRLARDLYARAWDMEHREPAVLEGWIWALVGSQDATEAVRLGHKLAAKEPYRETLDKLLIQEQLRFPLVNGAAALLRRGEEAPGLWVFQRQGELLPKDLDAQANLGLALRQVGRAAGARAAYERALALASRSEIANDLGLLLKGVGERDAAAKALTRSLGLQRVFGRGSAATNLGVLYCRAGIRARPDPLADLAAQLAQDPQQSLARQVTLDLLAREAAQRKSSAAGRGPRPAE